MNRYLFFIVFLLPVQFVFAQNKTAVLITKKDPENRYAVGFGANLASVNINRNYKENPYRPGINVRGMYEINNGIRVMAEYNYTPRFDLSPTWYNISNQIFGVSLNAKAFIKDQDVMVYSISGLCIQRWEGFYTGQMDISSARFYYQPNTQVLNKTLGLDLGLGFERPFPGFYLYGDFRYRFATVDKNFGITDVAYNLGLKFPFYKEDAKKNQKKKRVHKKGRGNDKYHWF